MALTDKLSAIGEAIRNKTGKSDLLTLDQMPGEISSITTGGGSSEDVRYVTFLSYDGSVEYGKKAVAVGDDCADPIARGVFDTPTKESTAQYNYTFAGWATTANGGLDSNALKAVEEDRTVYANFAAVVRSYTITFYDSDGTTVLKTETLAYGSTPSYTPEKDGCAFDSWSPTIATVTGDASYTAVWTEKITFANGTWAQIAEICAAGQAKEYFAVGDTKTITVSGESITLAVAGFDHDDLESGAKAPMTIVCMNIPSSAKHMWSYSGALTVLYYGSCNARFYLTGTKLFDLLPVALQAQVKAVVKKYDKSNNSGTPSLATTTDKVWFLSLDELGYPCDDNYYSNLGQRYELFPERTTGSNLPTATVGETTTKADYWTRTAARYGSSSFCYITSSGGFSNQSHSNTTERYFRFGFCI